MGMLGSVHPTTTLPSEHLWSQDRSGLGSGSPHGLIQRPALLCPLQELVPIWSALTTLRQGSPPICQDSPRSHGDRRR